MLSNHANEFSFHAVEEEVLVFPFTGFQVVNVKKEKIYDYDDIEITLLELPFQNLLQLNQ